MEMWKGVCRSCRTQHLLGELNPFPIHVPILLTVGFGTYSCQSCPRSIAAASGNGNTLTRDGERKSLLLDAALGTDIREGNTDPR